MVDKNIEEEKILFPEIFTGHTEDSTMHLGTQVRSKIKNKYYIINIRLQRQKTYTKQEAVDFMKDFMEEVYCIMLCTKLDSINNKFYTLDENQTP